MCIYQTRRYLPTNVRDVRGVAEAVCCPDVRSVDGGRGIVGVGVHIFLLVCEAVTKRNLNIVIVACSVHVVLCVAGDREDGFTLTTRESCRCRVGVSLGSNLND